MATENLSPSETAPETIASSDLAAAPAEAVSGETVVETSLTPKPSYVKLAMRNMVRKRGKSLQHFFLTTAALIGLFVGLAYLTR